MVIVAIWLLISPEILHLIAEFSLVVSGILVYFMDGFEMVLSCIIFGAMYISMSDVGEDEMSKKTKVFKSYDTTIISLCWGYF